MQHLLICFPHVEPYGEFLWLTVAHSFILYVNCFLDLHFLKEISSKSLTVIIVQCGNILLAGQVCVLVVHVHWGSCIISCRPGKHPYPRDPALASPLLSSRMPGSSFILVTEPSYFLLFACILTKISSPYGEISQISEFSSDLTQSIRLWLLLCIGFTVWSINIHLVSFDNVVVWGSFAQYILTFLFHLAILSWVIPPR